MRKVVRILKGLEKIDGDGVKVNRIFARPHVKDFDPFLFLDAFDTTNPADYAAGFPWHPHRGIETVTYLIHGDIEHQDSIGNKGSIKDGDCQWMTAGGGILHQETPRPVPRMLGIQLWINLPQKDKLAPPAYRGITTGQIPSVAEEGATVKIISGHYKGATGPTQGDYVKTLLLDVTLEKNASWRLNTDKTAKVFLFVIEGDGRFGPGDGQSADAKSALLFSSGTELAACAGPDGMRFILGAAQPLNEPIAWSGSIVMNTAEELEQAYRELENGTFVK